jgi:acetoin utilization protein AcuB
MPLVQAPVAAWMSTRLATIGPDASVTEALARMAEREVRRLPVVDEEGELIGIVTREDARGAQRRAESEADAPPLRHSMASQVYTVGSDASLAHVAQIMLRRQIGAVPVLQSGRLVGILTESDIFRFIAGQMG